MATRPITIEGINPDNTLVLSDKGKTIANPGDTIMWQVARQSGVAAITAINKKAGSPNVFNPQPGPVGGSSNWKGTIDTTISSPTDEEYSIIYTKTSGGSFDSDPKISVMPTNDFQQG